MQIFKFIVLVFFCVDKLYMGPGQLYQDLQNLIHDLSLVNQISNMISSLKGNYQVQNNYTKQAHELQSRQMN